MFLAYFFDAGIGAVEEVTIRKATALEELRQLIGCEYTDTVLLPDQHVVICDESGLGNSLESVAQVYGAPTPLAGNLVIARVEGGQFTYPSISIEDAAERIEVVRPLLDPHNGKAATNAAFSDFVIRLVKQKPRIIKTTPVRLKLVR